MENNKMENEYNLLTPKYLLHEDDIEDVKKEKK
jgi:hypothetical protein